VKNEAHDDEVAGETGGGDVDVDLIDYLLSLTPAERIRRQMDALELVKRLRRAGRIHHGIDSGSPPETH
jgi:hypothetical protein